MHRPHTPLALLALAIVVTLVAVPAALAKGRDQRAVRTPGQCTAQSTSKLRLKKDDRGTRVELSVDQDVAGVKWDVTVRVGDATVASLTATTKAPSGTFRVRRFVTAAPGTVITAVATSATGETCTASGATLTATATATSQNRHGGADDPAGHDAGDDHGSHSGSHA